MKPSADAERVWKHHHEAGPAEYLSEPVLRYDPNPVEYVRADIARSELAMVLAEHMDSDAAKAPDPTWLDRAARWLRRNYGGGE